MGEKITTIAAAIVTAVAAAAILTSKNFGGNARALGGTFSGAVHQIVLAAK